MRFVYGRDPGRRPKADLPAKAIPMSRQSAAYLDTPATAIRTFARGVDRLIRTIDTFP